MSPRFDLSLNNSLRVKHHFHTGLAVRKALGLILLQIIGGSTHGTGDYFPEDFITGWIRKIRPILFDLLLLIFYEAGFKWLLVDARSCFQDDAMDFSSSGCNLLADLTCKHCPFSQWVIFHDGLFRGSV